MKALISNKYIIFLSRCVLGTVFIVASLEKISIPEAFASAVEAYRSLPLPVINLFALLVPWVELICGLFLVAGIFVRASSLLLSSLLMLFIGAIIFAMLRNLSIDCGCFGSAHSTPIGWMKVLEDIGLFLLGLHVFLFPRSKFALENFYISHSVN